MVVLLFLVVPLVELPPPAAADFRSDSSILMFFLTSRHLDSVVLSNFLGFNYDEFFCEHDGRLSYHYCLWWNLKDFPF